MCSSIVLVVDIRDLFGRVSDPDSLVRSREPFLIFRSTDESRTPDFGISDTISPETPDENPFPSISSEHGSSAEQRTEKLLFTFLTVD